MSVSMLSIWKSFFLKIPNKHAPLRIIRIKVNSVSWMTSYNMTRRGLHIVQKFRIPLEGISPLRNQVNNKMRKAKCEFYKNKVNDCSKTKDLRKVDH